MEISLDASDKKIANLDFYTNTDDEGIPHNSYIFDTEEQGKQEILDFLNYDFIIHHPLE